MKNSVLVSDFVLQENKPPIEFNVPLSLLLIGTSSTSCKLREKCEYWLNVWSVVSSQLVLVLIVHEWTKSFILRISTL